MISEKSIFTISSNKDFEEKAIEIFQWQYRTIKIYRDFCDFLNVLPEEVKSMEDIPYLPIQFFKSHKVLAEGDSFEKIFTSSGTTGSITSKHYVTNLDIYTDSFTRAFILYFGPPEKYTILGLLPSYLEREGSSLIFMVDSLIKQSKSDHSGFYLNDLVALIKKLEYLESTGQKTILFGVTYALLDLISLGPFELNNTIILETGGMKGKRREMIKEALHQQLKRGFGVEVIYSEYGMTELLSQAYSKGGGIFTCPPWMKIVTRESDDALSFIKGRTGGLNIIDLANINSCSFIATQDLGKVHENGSFEILGRFDASDIRGCNLMLI